MTKIVLFLVGCAIALTVFALVWPWLAPAYARAQIFCAQLVLSPELRLTVDAEGIAVYRDGKFLTRREFLSFGGLGLTLALWLMTPGLSVKRRILWTAVGMGLLFLWHVVGLWGLIAFAQALEAKRAGGPMTLLYSVIAIGDWIVPVVLWGIILLGYRLRGSGATP